MCANCGKPLDAQRRCEFCDPVAIHMKELYESYKRCKPARRAKNWGSFGESARRYAATQAKLDLKGQDAALPPGDRE